mmetsp:Transcript_34733/g.69179  ORF Transcript_34733/g.69179 Transcript_34733/m.69179 type:complete len:91 (+) Transcript_34733:439-711(+)
MPSLGRHFCVPAEEVNVRLAGASVPRVVPRVERMKVLMPKVRRDFFSSEAGGTPNDKMRSIRSRTRLHRIFELMLANSEGRTQDIRSIGL